jgi:6-phosphogluconate dehydrogenase
MENRKYDIGMIGLGVMGRNLVLNMGDHGYAVVGYDKDQEKVDALNKEKSGQAVQGVKSKEMFLGLLKKPRNVMMLVPAGAPVDSVIQDILPHLEAEDLIIDGGNSRFTDTNRRVKMLAEKGFHILGIGISGGEKGARYGPSMMPGGSQEAYRRMQPIFEAVAAKVDGDPCVTYLGPGSAGHYVKMVHNGIEYGIIQLLAETYDLLRRGIGLDNDDLHDVYDEWNRGELESFLVEITAHIFKQDDEFTGKCLIDVILDAAKQKGTGKWTSQDAMELQVPQPTIDMAVVMRNMSEYKKERETAAKILEGPQPAFSGERRQFIQELRNSFYFAMITTYAQGMALLKAASKKYEYGLNLKDIARIWRGGCIIRAVLLEDIRAALANNPGLNNLMIEARFSKALMKRQNDIRKIIRTGVEWGIPVPALSVSLAYYDSYRSSRLPANLIQAQRDFFGSHTYERVDREGVFHTQWNQDEKGETW